MGCMVKGGNWRKSVRMGGGGMCVLVPISNIGFIHLLVAELCSGLN